MSGLYRRGAMWVVAAGVAALTALAGCGADGSSSATLGSSAPQIKPAISGTVWVPPGADFAAISGWRKWLETVFVAPRAYAEIPGEERIQTETWVTLDWLTAVDAADGTIDSPRAVSDGLGVGRTDQKRVVHDHQRGYQQPRCVSDVCVCGAARHAKLDARLCL